MKKIILSICLVIGYLQADYYILTMDDSKSSLCRDMKVVFDKFIGGEELNSFKEFQAIKWDKKYNIIYQMNKYDATGKKLDRNKKYADFDINNDGKDEIVESGVISYKKYGFFDDLTYFDTSIKPMIIKENSLKRYKLRNYISNSIPSSYELIKYASYKIDNDNLKFYPSIVDSHIRPFLYKDKYYIALFGNQTYYIELEPKKIRDNNQAVIVEFTKENKINDLCYYIKVGE